MLTLGGHVVERKTKSNLNFPFVLSNHYVQFLKMNHYDISKRKCVQNQEMGLLK
jgi:hypothetical protein